MSWVVATSAATSTCALRPKTMPLGLTIQTCPLALRRPRISDGLPPTTRFSAIDPADGCWKRVCSRSPTLKSFHSMIALSVVWRMSRVPGAGCVMVALPPTTCPPCGLAAAGHGDTATASAAATLVSAVDVIRQRRSARPGSRGGTAV